MECRVNNPVNHGLKFCFIDAPSGSTSPGRFISRNDKLRSFFCVFFPILGFLMKTCLPFTWLFPAVVLLMIALSCNHAPSSEIDRKALVNRHDVHVTEPDPLNPLTIGNGKFAYTADITGMQSFYHYHEKGIPLGTFADWAWHSFPNPEEYTLQDVVRYYHAGTDSVPYWYQFSTGSQRQVAATAWLRENPHRMHLGMLGLILLDKDSSRLSINDLEPAGQHLDLWTGRLTSTFLVNGKPVEVISWCHPEKDLLSFRIRSSLLLEGKLIIQLLFPYARHEKFSPGYDFSVPEKHISEISWQGGGSAALKHTLDEAEYYARLEWGASGRVMQNGRHEYFVIPARKDSVFYVSCLFSARLDTADIPGFEKLAEEAEDASVAFWEGGAAVDFSACTDPRAQELERRVVLSQYLTRIQCTGIYPPQETGLTFNSWHGKFHLEMHWWHALHFLLWDRAGLIEQQFGWYNEIMDRGLTTSAYQGYKVARWPKMTDPSGRESPSTIGVFLIWQQPHTLYFAELLYQHADNKAAILDAWGEKVLATGAFMNSFMQYDSINGRYVLGPPLIPAQERFAPETTLNPSFELAYWHWGFKTYLLWRNRMNLATDSLTEQILRDYARLPVSDSLYLLTENARDSYTNPLTLTDHPMVLGLSGFLPPMDYVDTAVLRKTAEIIHTRWDWQATWGWDMPLAAMNAVVLGDPAEAMDLLMMDTPKNTWLANGHNFQHTQLPVYLPGNGGLLSAVSLMCTFRDKNMNDGFPNNGSWSVKYENMKPWLQPNE